ncbi:palmitoyltransferase YKT6 [Ascoidea rubescens DSM 1968]|uniref:Synaptobrevin homolog YKT6 n=1 Tax=Ascoidea rubescens DSM 1968 TaxID=1344418 RepID=A0A1D2V957_9ASCO|nr:synaptobrevin-like protein YKT6 [Ascoidea rubescens DSM 1968]ODV58180.1 synaptobrevin-like protein YKT6 [Ascoidea rubescens DSM 1968]
MKIYYIGILKPVGDKEAVELSKTTDLSQFSFFERNGVSQFMSFMAETASARTEPGQRQSIEEGNYVGHVYLRSEGLAGVLVTDKEYPVRAAYTLLNKILDEYIMTFPPMKWKHISGKQDPSIGQLNFSDLESYIKRYQDPGQADAIMRVQQELDETKIILHKTIESVLQRGERLDSLVDKSEALSTSSRTFYKTAKKTNSCCVVM